MCLNFIAILHLGLHVIVNVANKTGLTKARKTTVRVVDVLNDLPHAERDNLHFDKDQIFSILGSVNQIRKEDNILPLLISNTTIEMRRRIYSRSILLLDNNVLH